MRLRRACVVAGALALTIALACTERNNGDDGGASEGAAGECPDAPEPAEPCIPDCGNEVGVGKPCTTGGGECNGNSTANLCTADFVETTLAYCTKPCVEDADCGSDAVCRGDPAAPDGPKGCAPAACVA